MSDNSFDSLICELNVLVTTKGDSDFLSTLHLLNFSLGEKKIDDFFSRFVGERKRLTTIAKSKALYNNSLCYLSFRHILPKPC